MNTTTGYISLPSGEQPEASDKFTRVRIRRQHKMCKCGGEFKSRGHGISNNVGSSWSHSCDKCRAEGWFDSAYPCLVYEDAALPRRGL